MKKEYIKINSNCDGLPLGAAIYQPEADDRNRSGPSSAENAIDEDCIKGVVQFSHGMAEHKERYYPLMEYLAANGFASAINDHRGHGESVRSKEDRGYFYDDTSDFVVEDIHQITTELKKRFPGKPVYLFGHSMGSLIVRKYIKKYDDEISKLIVCGSPSRNPMVGAALLIVRIQKAIKGDRYRSKLIQKLAFGSYNKNIQSPVSENAWLSADENNVRNYDGDEECGFTFTLNGFRNLFTLMKEIYRPEGWALKNENLPIFFIAGEADPVIVSEKAWKESIDFLRKVGYHNVSGKLYPGLRHEILNEKQAQTIYEDILTFLQN